MYPPRLHPGHQQVWSLNTFSPASQSDVSGDHTKLAHPFIYVGYLCQACLLSVFKKLKVCLKKTQAVF